MKKLRIGIIGCGRISVMHLLSVQNIDCAKLVCCCDIKRDRAEKVAGKYGVPYYTDYKVMFAKEKLDAVHVLLPHYLHVPVSVYAFEHGVNVLSEKPMSIDYESALYAVKKAKERNVFYGVVSQCRYNRAIRFVKSRIDEGYLGKIISARSVLTWQRNDEYYSASDWKGTWDKEGGGVVIDQAIHSIDLVDWIVGSKVKTLSCSMANRGHKTINVEDTAEGFIQYENGTTYSFYCTNNYGFNEPIEIRFYCEKGNVVMNYDDAYIYYNDGKTEEEHRENNVHIFDEGKDYWGVRHIKQIEQFYKACLGLEPLEISGEEALKTQKLICDIYERGGMKNT